MDMLTHTLLAITVMAGCWFWGRHLSSNSVIEHLLITLERDGYIKVKTDKDGDKCLVKSDDLQ